MLLMNTSLKPDQKLGSILVRQPNESNDFGLWGEACISGRRQHRKHRGTEPEIIGRPTGFARR